MQLLIYIGYAKLFFAFGGRPCASVKLRPYLTTILGGF
ncbi:hypothetical protein BLJAPNOD_00844 [Ensifer sp. M14]|nr:hypothetical protein BLJAPNOD_00844 [Ensifer sp. M14]